jgi:nitrite reductase (NADH) large subunit
MLIGYSLGRYVALDAATARHVAPYSDQRRDILDNREGTARSTSLVDAPGVPDPSIGFESGRGRPVPAQGERRPVPLGLPATREVPR